MKLLENDFHYPGKLQKCWEYNSLSNSHLILSDKYLNCGNKLDTWCELYNLDSSA